MNVKTNAWKRAGMAAAMAAACVAWAGCGGSEAPATKAEAVSGLHFAKLEAQRIPEELEAPGTVIAADTAQLGPRTMGTVEAVLVREGDSVRRGQLLAQIDERELAARVRVTQAGTEAGEAGIVRAQKGVAAAEAQAALTQKTYDRYVYLKEQKSVSPQEFDEIKSKQDAAQAALEQARAALKQAQAGGEQANAEWKAAQSVASYARIVAPFDGRVVRRQVDAGTVVAPGMTLFVVESGARYQLEVTLPAEALAYAKKGLAVRVELDEPAGSSLDGKIAEMEAGADPVSHTVRARVELPAEATVKSGVFGRAYLAHGEKRALLLPKEAVVARGQLQGVYAVDANGMVQWRVVTLGRAREGKYEVLAGLGEGDVVVLSPASAELDGKRATGAPVSEGKRS